MQTAWGSRDGADEDDAYRMIRVTQKQQHEAFEYRRHLLSIPHQYDPRDCDRGLVSSLLVKLDSRHQASALVLSGGRPTVALNPFR